MQRSASEASKAWVIENGIKSPSLSNGCRGFEPGLMPTNVDTAPGLRHHSEEFRQCLERHNPAICSAALLKKF